MYNLRKLLWTLLLLACGAAGAAPHVPENDSVVLARVPAASEARRLEPLRRRLQADPADLQSALALSRGYLLIGRETSDPRFASYAHAALSAWLRRPDPPAQALVLSATALQNTHRFDDALVLLDRALRVDPRNAQAWLTKATLLQVKGNLRAARDACRPLLPMNQLVGLACMASVDSLSGNLAPSYRALVRVSQSVQAADAGERSWLLGLLAEMAVRLGDFRAAEMHFRSALQAEPKDAYLKAAYADLLLLTHREREALAVLRNGEANDVLLLRLAIAGRRLGDSRADEWARTFDARRRAARPDDTSHLREHARFLLEVRDDPRHALEVAQANWRVQREPADIRVYVRAAERSGRPEAARAVHEWIRDAGYEDRTLP